MPSDEHHRLHGVMLLMMLVTNEYIMLGKAIEEGRPPVKGRTKYDDAKNLSCEAKTRELDSMEGDATSFLQVGVVVSHNHSKQQDLDGKRTGAEVCCCKKWGDQADHPWWDAGESCSMKGEGYIIKGGTQEWCCKVRKGSCDWLAYSKPLKEATAGAHEKIPGCGAPKPAKPPKTTSTGADADFGEASMGLNRGKVKGAWDNGYMFYVGGINQARGLTGAIAKVAEGTADSLAVAGEAALPVALVFGGIGLATAEVQIRKLKRNLDMKLSEPQEKYIQCQIKNQRTNQAVTVCLMGVAVAGIAGAFTGIGAVVAGAVAAAVVIGNKIRNKFACQSEGKAMDDWIEARKATIAENLAQTMQVADDAEEKSKGTKRSDTDPFFGKDEVDQSGVTIEEIKDGEKADDVTDESGYFSHMAQSTDPAEKALWDQMYL